jgi:hypothetical protein
MIISTGMRTDIPAFYSKWLIKRLEEGYVCVRNPYNESQVTRYKLNPQVVDCLCFCTKNPIPILPYLDKMKDYKQFWFVTITPYDKTIEPNVVDKSKVIEAFKTLSKYVGKNAIGWRYDPIFYSDYWNKERHIEAFKKIAESLKGYTNFCVISILDLYEKVKKNAPGIYPPTREEQLELLAELVKIAKANGMIIKGCYEGKFLESVGVDCSGCQTKEVIETAIGVKLNVPSRKNARGACNCLLGQDIGAYNTCGHLCKYCYANADKQTVLKNMARHNPNSPLLIGELKKTDKITDAKQESYKALQISLF